MTFEKLLTEWLKEHHPDYEITYDKIRYRDGIYGLGGGEHEVLTDGLILNCYSEDAQIIDMYDPNFFDILDKILSS